MGTKPLKTTRADRRLKENKHLPPYEDKFRNIKNSKVIPPDVEYQNPQHIRILPNKPTDESK